MENTSTPTESSANGGCFPVIAQKAPQAILVIDSSGIVHYANTAWMRMHGYIHLNEVLGKKITIFHTEEQLSKDVLPFLNEVKSRGQISGSVGHVHKNGKPILTNTTMLALKDDLGKIRAVVVYAVDTSENEKLNEEIKTLKLEAEKRKSELTLTTKRLGERAKELEMVENLLSARGTELSTVNKQLWQYMSEREQYLEQIQALKTSLADKEKEVNELNVQLQRQKAEQARIETQSRVQYDSLRDALKLLRNEIIEMKHHEVEFLDGIEEYPEPVGAKGGLLDKEQLKQISCMAKKFANE